MPYAAEWKDCRRAFWQHFHPGALKAYRHVQVAVARRFLVKLLRNPTGMEQHIRLYAVPHTRKNANLVLNMPLT